MTVIDERLEQQLAFLLELDKAKSIYRRSYVTQEARNENDGEHMWHLALLVLVLAEHADEPIDVLHAMQLVLVHDIVEIDAGDVFVYDHALRATKEAEELKAADRIYGLLPREQGQRLRALWEEFEARETPEARFAAAVDRLQPLMLNVATEGRAWREHGITANQVLELNSSIGNGSTMLWAVAQRLIANAVERGYLSAGPAGSAGSAGPT